MSYNWKNKYIILFATFTGVSQLLTVKKKN